jgi:cupin 2 domain-containing protein
MFKHNLFSDLESLDGSERFDDILKRQNVRIERIVSKGHVSDPSFWYEQAWDEWVLVVSGSAVLEFDKDSLKMVAGDHVLIPAFKRHRVKSTSLTDPTVWLAIHLQA